MKPIPVVFHLGPLQIHTYGVGLAITFLFAAWYLSRRFRAKGLPYAWVSDAAFWIIVAAVIGARVVHVVANLSFYLDNPAEVPIIWHGGLSSFGGLLFAVPTGIYLMRKAAPSIGALQGMDVSVPMLAAAWSLGRLLGPQVMIHGGGHRTDAWYGMSYAGQAGERVPVPVFQSLMDFATFLILIAVDRRTGGKPRGLITSLGAGLWGLSRFFEEWFWLSRPGRWDSVEVIGLALSAAGWISLIVILGRARRGGDPNANVGEPTGAASLT